MSHGDDVENVTWNKFIRFCLMGKQFKDRHKSVFYLKNEKKKFGPGIYNDKLKYFV